MCLRSRVPAFTFKLVSNLPILSKEPQHLLKPLHLSMLLCKNCGTIITVDQTITSNLKIFIKTTKRIKLTLQGKLKDGAYYCYCAYVLRISRYSDFLSPILTNTGIFLRGLKLSGGSIS